MLVQKQAQEPVSKRMPTNVEATLEELRVCQESAHLIKGGAPSHWGICGSRWEIISESPVELFQMTSLTISPEQHRAKG